MYIQGKYICQGEPISALLAIREQVFQQEQGIARELDVDGLDEAAIHAACYRVEEQEKKDAEKVIVATGRLICEEGRYLIGRVAVLKQERGRKYGDFVVKMLVYKAFQLGAREVYCNAQAHAVGFYQKIGFEQCGEAFEEAGRQHIPLVLREGSLCRACEKME